MLFIIQTIASAELKQFDYMPQPRCISLVMCLYISIKAHHYLYLGRIYRLPGSGESGVLSVASPLWQGPPKLSGFWTSIRRKNRRLISVDHFTCPIRGFARCGGSSHGSQRFACNGFFPKALLPNVISYVISHSFFSRSYN